MNHTVGIKLVNYILRNKVASHLVYNKCKEQEVNIKVLYNIKLTIICVLVFQISDRQFISKCSM